MIQENIIVIDFEVLPNAKFWLCCMKDYKTGKEHTIINDTNEFKRVFSKNQNSVWVGYNIKGYDQWLMRAILADYSPFEVNDKIIGDNIQGWNINPKLNRVKLNIFELGSRDRSLKELELFMGESIVESSVPFSLETYPNQEELETLIKYCLHDVRMTFEVFKFLKHEFDSYTGLIELYKLDNSAYSKTKAQLSSFILEAKKPAISRNDEFDFEIIDTLKLNKYNFVRNWYLNKENRNYNKNINVMVYGVEIIFGWGGVHGARSQFESEGIIINSDVSSFYPAIMIEYNTLSRNVKHPEKFKEIRDTRLKLKQLKDKIEASLKIVLNSSFGASKDRFNELYDPQMGNATCVNGQLLLLDLIEKVEETLGDNAILIQCNTDGVMFSFKTEDDALTYKDICNEWCNRTRMGLEHDHIKKIIQKDVNNYIYITDNEKIKCKGAYVKNLNMLDNDLPIVNMALRNKLLYNIPIKQTVYNSTNLIDFQKCVKISSKYQYAVHGDEIIPLKVLRVFASKKNTDGPVLKVKKESSTAEKIGNTPNNAFIINERILEKEIPENLDRDWYVDLAEKRLREFIPENIYEFTLLDMLN